MFFLYLFFITSLSEITFFGLLFGDFRVFIAFLASIFITFIIIISGNEYAYYLILLIILAWPFYIYSIQREQIELKEKRINKNKQEIDRLERELDKRRDYAPLLRLGKLYEENDNLEKALEYYKKAESETQYATLSVTHTKIKQIEYILKSEEETKILTCKNCGKKNYPGSLFCERCNKMLHSSYLDYIRHSAPPVIKAGVVILFISAVLFGVYLRYWVNFLFYTLLIIDVILLRKKIRRER